MRWHMIELSIHCPRCETPIHIDGPSGEVFCGKCMSSTEFPGKVWENVIGDALKEAGKMKPGQGTQSTIFGHFRMSLLHGNQVPYCLECKKDFDPEKDRSLNRFTCSDCGAVMPCREAPSWFKAILPRVKLLAGTPPESKDKPDSPEKTGEGAVALSCPKCSASLLVNGEDRLVPCCHCGTRVYLPDDLWLRLHPAKTKTRWFIGF